MRLIDTARYYQCEVGVGRGLQRAIDEVLSFAEIMPAVIQNENNIYYQNTELQAGFIAIPGSSNPDHIAENYDIFDFELTVVEMDMITAVDRHERYENW